MIARTRPETSYWNIFSSFFSNNKYRILLVKKITEYFNVKNAILLTSARGGLYFLFKALPQKRVFIPAYTCWVVVEAAKLAGKEVFFIDIKLDDYNMNPEILKSKILPDSIILATHQFGIPCDIEKIIQIANENNCYVIEDNAAGFGSEYKNKKTGSFAGASVVSFEFTKPLTCGRGGAILFNDESLYKEVKTHTDNSGKKCFIYSLNFIIILLINKILTQKSIYAIVNAVYTKFLGSTTAYPNYGSNLNYLYNSSLGNISCKLLYKNFMDFEKTILKQKEIISFYQNLLKENKQIIIPSYDAYKFPVFMRYPVYMIEIEKNIFYKKMNKLGIDLGFTFSYSCDPNKENSPVSFMAAKSVLNLPTTSSLKKRDLIKIAKSFKKIL